MCDLRRDQQAAIHTRGKESEGGVKGGEKGVAGPAWANQAELIEAH